MSRGLSKAQSRILGLLDGTARGEVYGNCRGGLDTAELVEELRAAGLVGTGGRRRALFTVRRACASLARRGLLKGRRVADCNNPGGVTVSWEAVAEAPAGPRKAGGGS